VKITTNTPSLALLLIAACAVSTGVSGQNVYRCGAVYSQTPCPEGVLVDAVDTRSKAQKTQADQATARDVKAANALEKAHLKEDQDAAARSQPKTKVGKSSTAKSKPKRKKEPEFFTAKAAPEKMAAPSKSGN
jgi:hypothetical protein